MSDNSNSTGSTGSSTNSWTLLSPEEAAVENVGPVDDGTESLGDVPSLSEEIPAASGDFKSADVSVETVLSEEGHQVCQETSPESSEGPIPSSPSRMSPLLPSSLDPPDLDLESQPPIIHDIVTTSPSDHEHLGAAPFITNISMGTPLEIPPPEFLPAELEESCSASPPAETLVSTEQTVDTAAAADVDVRHIPDVSPDGAGDSAAAAPEIQIPAENITAATDSPSHDETEISFTPDVPEPPSHHPESLVTESPVDHGPAPETVGSLEAEEEEQEQEEEQEEEQEPSEALIQDEREEEEEEPSSHFDVSDTSGFDDDGLRRRNVPSFDAPRPRTSDEEDEEEEVVFKVVEKKAEKPFFSLNKCIVGALILLFLGSLFLSGDFDGSDLNDEQSQDWLNSDPQEMKELLDKLTQENQQIAQLEAQLQAQKEELDSALKAVAASGDEQGKANLEKENTKLKEELSSLPELKKELEGLRARVTELSQITADQEMPAATSSQASRPGGKDAPSAQQAAGPERRKDPGEGRKVAEELRRQKALLEESRKRLEGMKKDGGDRRRVRDSLEEIQKKLSEQVERWGKKKPQEPKWKGNNKGKMNERDHWKKEEKKEWRGEKDWKHGKDGGWREKEEKKEKEWKSQKQNSHKEAWRKHQDEWERKKGDRRRDREERRKEKPWHSRPGKNSHNHHQPQPQQQPRQPQQPNRDGFWRDQEQKLRRNIRPHLSCSSAEDCAAKEGLYPVELPEFEELLEGYLSKLEGSSSQSKDKIRKLTADFFEDGVFVHDRVLFSDFAEDVADILEDMVDVLEDGGKKDDDSLEEEMEEFEREALWKFAATA
ncbi:uncharacterized protein V6R79_002743 [Siganus canaliculatus]